MGVCGVCERAVFSPLATWGPREPPALSLADKSRFFDAQKSQCGYCTCPHTPQQPPMRNQCGVPAHAHQHTSRRHDTSAAARCRIRLPRTHEQTRSCRCGASAAIAPARSRRCDPSAAAGSRIRLPRTHEQSSCRCGAGAAIAPARTHHTSQRCDASAAAGCRIRLPRTHEQLLM